MRTGVIYKLLCQDKDRLGYYYGRAKIWDTRQDQHFDELSRHTHHNKKLQDYFNKYGWAAIEKIIVEEPPLSLLQEREAHYVNTAIRNDPEHCFNERFVYPFKMDQKGCKSRRETQLEQRLATVCSVDFFNRAYKSIFADLLDRGVFCNGSTARQVRELLEDNRIFSRMGHNLAAFAFYLGIEEETSLEEVVSESGAILWKSFFRKFDTPGTLWKHLYPTYSPKHLIIVSLKRAVQNAIDRGQKPFRFAVFSGLSKAEINQILCLQEHKPNKQEYSLQDLIAAASRMANIQPGGSLSRRQGRGGATVADIADLVVSVFPTLLTPKRGLNETNSQRAWAVEPLVRTAAQQLISQGGCDNTVEAELHRLGTNEDFAKRVTNFVYMLGMLAKGDYEAAKAIASKKNNTLVRFYEVWLESAEVSLFIPPLCDEEIKQARIFFSPTTHTVEVPTRRRYGKTLLLG